MKHKIEEIDHWYKFFECPVCHGLYKFEEAQQDKDEVQFICIHCHSAKLDWEYDRLRDG